ncbi:MAG: [protein-PII] uridylyltransferase [Gammaproteobacteria bacterium]|nr:[protein-PII] uridylyltransferase [Gammaproteobacteria bacterium]
MLVTAKNAAAEETLSQSAEHLRLAADVMTGNLDEIDWPKLESRLAEPGLDLTVLRHILASGNAALTLQFTHGATAGRLVADRTKLIDLILLAAWRMHVEHRLKGAALIAVGGYGRGELLPKSDIDLLILLDDHQHARAEEPISDFLTLLWDLGLDIGHSTRNVDECKQQAHDDISVVTSLMESRLLTGPENVFDQMQRAIGPDEIWSTRSYFEAKLKEQHARHARYNDTANNLEPNVKGTPGGLRDIQMIVWVTKRHFGTSKLNELVEHDFLTPGQLRLLQQGREFLWRIRFALHTLTGRHEDRLLFDYQSRIAKLFGYKDASYMLAVEQLMQRYYRTVMDLSRLNEMLLQLFQEAILMNPNVAAEPLNERFQIKNGFLQIVAADTLEEHPSAMLEMFVLLQQHPELKGVSATTISAIKRSLHLVDDGFRQDPRNHELFLSILRAPAGVTHELRRMNLYGVLGRYIPAFGRIVGRMQYDLFHAYTVDAHTLFVVSNLRRFALPRFDHEFPLCSELMQGLPSADIVYLAGLFHDIAKGRGGDHSELGAVDAEAFCLEHGMSRYDARLVAWLVRNHLTLSLTAQKKDIGDPEVIREFAAIVGDQTHLEYLYLLTVADVRATNPELWNSWREQLFEGLYSLTRQALRRGLENPIDKEELLLQRREDARFLLAQTKLGDAAIDAAWSNFTDEYFIRCRPDEIASHTRLFAESQVDRPQVMVDLMRQAYHGGTAVFLFSPQDYYSFAAATGVFDELGLNIADARIVPLHNNWSLATFVVLEQTGGPIADPLRLEQIKSRLIHALTTLADAPVQVSRRAPRQVRMFPTETIVAFSQDSKNGRTVMELVAGDRPGLLSEVGQVLRANEITIQTAKILTIGARAEDVFYIMHEDGRPLDAAECERLEQALTEALSQPGN